ncbi:hypothetical protein [Serinibacter salmoneus]|uniref:Phosphotransferase family enzyme n=1 Tax=Serinibacter salmoneus TaxID=556530 RepID=A0A2A9D0X6_9MICO|nr:hypothetical protein [Serinibacter salmoneus]PFG19915.1 hypothetical protein ATL40_1492 [Serinibacter salmoneus]
MTDSIGGSGGGADVLARVSHAVARLLGVEVLDAADLGGSDRSVVARLHLSDGRTVIAKQYTDGEAHRHERLGLAHLPGTPELVATDDVRRLLVMSDIGTGATLADLLLGENPTAAREGALSWARALGAMVGSTHAEVETLRPRIPVDPTFDAAAVVRTGVERLADLVGLDDAARAAASAEVATLEVLLAPSPHDVLWPSDTCPDNAILTDAGWRFLDLEGTSASHPAIVAAYAHLPFATCWCVMEPPADLTAAMTEAFTAALAEHLPEVTGTGSWERQVALADAVWVIASTTWLLPRALEGDGPIGPEGRPSPTRRQLLAARWRALAVDLAPHAPALARLAGAAAEWARTRWAEPGLGPYPAFAGENDRHTPRRTMD